MASEIYLYSKTTHEAVEVIRCGANGLQTPQGSSKAIFAFMSYHMGENAIFALTELQSIGQLGEDVQFVHSLEERECERKFNQEMQGDVTLVLLWEDASAEQLLGRKPTQLKAIEGYRFSQPTLNTIVDEVKG